MPATLLRRGVFSRPVRMPLGYGAADDLPGHEPGRRPAEATPELEGLARAQPRAHKEAEEDGRTAAAHSDASSSEGAAAAPAARLVPPPAQVNLGRQRTDRLPCKYVTTVVRSLRVLTPTAMKVIYPSFVGARRGASHSNAARPDAESQPDAAVDLARYDHSDSHAPASPTVRWNAGRQSQ